jgi:dolichyl-phosphate-mannose-protein mannosyltransferase
MRSSLVKVSTQSSSIPRSTAELFTLYADGEDLSERVEPQEAKVAKKMNFFKKFFELQMLMLQHNAGLTASHPYASGPINWPFVISGISFWTENDTKKQIYLAGNVVGWWLCAVAISVYVGIMGADALARRRGIKPISSGSSVTPSNNRVRV